MNNRTNANTTFRYDHQIYDVILQSFFSTKVNTQKLKYQIQEVTTTNSSSSPHALKKTSIVNTASTMFSSFQYDSKIFFYKLKYVFIRSDPSPISIRAFCGQTYDRSTSAYTSKKRSHRHYPSFTTVKDDIDQSTSVNILSRVAEKLDDNEIKRDYLIPPKTIKRQNDYIDKSSKSKHYSTQNNPSNLSDIYIKLSDCQAACRFVKILSYHRSLIHYSIDAGLLNIINKSKHIFSLHIIERKNIHIEKQKYRSVIKIFPCL